MKPPPGILSAPQRWPPSGVSKTAACSFCSACIKGLLRIRVMIRVLVFGRRERREVLGFGVEVVHTIPHLWH